MFTLVSGVHVCDKVIKKASIYQARLAQSVEHHTYDLKDVSSSPAVFSFCILRSWQVDLSHASEIKHDVHPRYIGAKREKDNFKSHEVKRLKECALALSRHHLANFKSSN